MMGSLRALQEWCRLQCENYQDVEIKDMSTSFRDGLAFCAIIHRYRPELIDFGSLSKDDIYENNRLAFEVAEAQLGIPALLDPEDMVSMKVPDRLSIITYVSQYYNFFNNKTQANIPCMKRLGSVCHNEPAQKRPPTPLEEKEVETEPSQNKMTGLEVSQRGTLSSICTACQQHVHLVQRFLVDGKLYHRNCFRCTECHSTLLPGSYKLGSDSGTLVCTHHITRQASANLNGRPDLSKRPIVVQSVRIGRSMAPHTSATETDQQETPAPLGKVNDTGLQANVTVIVTPVPTNNDVTLEETDLLNDSGQTEEKHRPPSPPNPFDESDEDENEQSTVEDTLTNNTDNGDPPSKPVNQNEALARPVPAPRRVAEASPPPRPSPRVKLPRSAESLATGEHQKPPTPPKPRERSQSPRSLSCGTHKPKDPPWLALVQSETKKKKPPPPPPAGLTTPANTGSVCSLKEEGSGSSPPTVPSNPFEDDDDEKNEAEVDEEGNGIPATLAASHPWYNITQVSEASAVDTTQSTENSSRSTSPGSAKSKKRPAPRVPLPPSANQVLPHSQHSSCSPALSVESLSSGSDHSSSQPCSASGGVSDQETSFTKSVSEPSICSPSIASPSSSSSAERLPHSCLSSFTSPAQSNASSAPATPQVSRSHDTKMTGPSPPRPTTSPSPLAAGTSPSHNKPICKENPFNRKVSPSPTKSNRKAPKGPRPSRPPAPGHGFPLIKRKVQSDQYIPVENIHGEMSQLEIRLDELEQRGVELEKKLRDNPNAEDEEHLLVDWFTLIHEKHQLVRREAELVYTAKQQNLEERQADVEYELRCLLNKPEKDWTEEDKNREQQLMAELVTIIEQRNQIVNSMDQDRQREEEEDKFMEAVLKKKDFHKESDGDQQKKKVAKFKPMKVLKRLSHKGEPGKSPRKENS
ncbi:MICAL-like protein 1 isoform X2 [Corythoichthys intestinalis]|uniref:MICAL-like protein 1 isoform X2 n=1 Tax=Corythoichthys intestinalis TaxID=161448 RepID=UPI0025A5A518|nr:MICAL-like protein 1 isoform X2 [Corythoichthys intestinalis]